MLLQLPVGNVENQVRHSSIASITKVYTPAKP